MLRAGRSHLRFNLCAFAALREIFLRFCLERESYVIRRIVPGPLTRDLGGITCPQNSQGSAERPFLPFVNQRGFRRLEREGRFRASS